MVHVKVNISFQFTWTSKSEEILTSQFSGLVTNVHTTIIIYLYTTFGSSKRKHKSWGNKSNYWDLWFSGMLHGVGRQLIDYWHFGTNRLSQNTGNQLPTYTM